MQLRSELSIANPAGEALRVDKLFQVAFVGAPDNLGARNVNVFSAIVLSSANSDGRFPSVTLTTSVDSEAPRAVADVRKFFGRPKLLSQFWDHCKSVNAPDELHLGRDARDLKPLMDVWPDRADVHPLLIEEPEFKQTHPSKRLLVIPTAATFVDENRAVHLACRSGQPRLKKYALRLGYGTWVHERFVAHGPPDEAVVDFDYQLIALESVPLDECRIYFCFPPYSDVLEQVAHVSFRTSASLRSANREYRVQVHHLYSQRTTEYFEEWNRLGINSSTLLRLNPSAEWAHAFTQAWTQVQAQLRLADSTAQRRADRKALVASVMLATAVALGIDETRLARIVSLLPHVMYLRPLFWWLLLCVVSLPLIFPPPKIVNRRLSRVFAFAAMAAVTVWSAVAFIATDELRHLVRAETWAASLAPIACVCGVGAAFAQRSTSMKRLGIWIARRIAVARGRSEHGGETKQPA